jgi:hypothetical protein
MLTSVIASTSFVELSYATPFKGTPMGKDNRPDPNDLVNQGVQCGPPKGNPNANAICIDTTVPSAVPSTGIAVAQQTKDILAGLSIGKDGGVYVTFKAGGANWNTAAIGPKGIFPAHADIAMAKQTNDILTAVAIGNDGALQVLWVVGTGKWNGPVPISPKGMFTPGGDVAMVKQTNDRLTAWAVGVNGWLYQAWVDGTRQWNDPVGRPIFVCCQSHYDSTSGPYRGFDSKRYSIAADRLPNGMVAVLVVDIVGQLKMVPIVGLCNLDKCENVREQYVKLNGWPYPIPKTLGPWKLFPVGAELAMVQHTKDISTVLSIGNNGAMYVSWFDLVAGATWKDPIQVSPPDTFPRGSSIAAGKHIPNVITAFTVGNDGAIHVSWTTQAGWNKAAGVKGPGPYPPVPITPKGMFNPGAGVAMVNFNGVLEGFAIGKDGGIYTSWISNGPWNGPVKISQAQLPPGGPPLQPPPGFGNK